MADAYDIAGIVERALRAQQLESEPDYDETDPADGTCIKTGMWVTLDGRTYHIEIRETSTSVDARSAE